MRGFGSVRASIGSIVFGFEFVIVGLGALAGFGLKVTDPRWVALLVGGCLVVLMLAAIPLMRFSWGPGFGWAVQILVVISGFFVHMMFAAGAIFIAIWAYGMIKGAQIDRYKASVDAAYARASSEARNGTENPS